MSYTPGPWVIEPLKGKYYGTRVLLGGGVIEVWTEGTRPSEPSKREIADGWTDDMGMDHVESAEDYANARLIAAAPELLDALTRMLKQFPADSDLYAAGWDSSAINEACDAYDAARAAIRKATGEE